MKIEKLTENKIRVLVHSSDFELNNLDAKAFLSNAMENNYLLADILKKADDEVGFNTDGCKLLIESFSSSENILVFTITKYSPKVQKKKLIAKRKTQDVLTTHSVFKFESFDDFCLLCEHINKSSLFDIGNFPKNISLYLYNDTYFLVIKNFNNSYQVMKSFYFIITEFATPLPSASNFESRLLEYGKVIIKNNAILTGIKYFVSK